MLGSDTGLEESALAAFTGASALLFFFLELFDSAGAEV